MKRDGVCRLAIQALKLMSGGVANKRLHGKLTRYVAERGPTRRVVPSGHKSGARRRLPVRRSRPRILERVSGRQAPPDQGGLHLKPAAARRFYGLDEATDERRPFTGTGDLRT